MQHSHYELRITNYELILRNKDLSGYARRCAERLCLSDNRSSECCGCAAAVRRSLTKVEDKRNGKAQPFRTSGGRAALLRNITNYKSEITGKNYRIINNLAFLYLVIRNWLI